ncbi:MAG: hypothetical protein GTO22_22585 [Gemmatimonadales bacterium]|nr:hypothetical protein [Gemmatimonadales bacterium]
MPRFQVYATHPLQHLTEQGRYFMELLMERQRQQKEDEFRQQELELRREREARAADAYNLQRAKTLAEMEAGGYQVTEPRPTKMPEVRRPEPPKPEIGMPTGEPTALTRPVSFSEELAAIREPVELGTSRYDISPPSPERALELARQAPAHILGLEEEERRLSPYQELADVLGREGVPAGVAGAVRTGPAGLPVYREWLENVMGPTGTAADRVTATAKHAARNRAYFEILDSVQARMRGSTSYGHPDFGKTMEELIAEEEVRFRRAPGWFMRTYNELLDAGEFGAGSAAGAPAAGAGTAGEALSEAEVGSIVGDIPAGLSDSDIRSDLEVAGYTNTQIEQILKARR